MYGEAFGVSEVRREKTREVVAVDVLSFAWTTLARWQLPPSLPSSLRPSVRLSDISRFLYGENTDRAKIPQSFLGSPLLSSNPRTADPPDFFSEGHLFSEDRIFFLARSLADTLHRRPPASSNSHGGWEFTTTRVPARSSYFRLINSPGNLRMMLCRVHWAPPAPFTAASLTSRILVRFATPRGVRGHSSVTRVTRKGWEGRGRGVARGFVTSHADYLFLRRESSLALPIRLANVEILGALPAAPST